MGEVESSILKSIHSFILQDFLNAIDLSIYGLIGGRGGSMDGLNLYHTMTTFDALKNEPFENIVGKEEILVTSIFFFSHSVFYPIKDNLNVLSNV